MTADSKYKKPLVLAAKIAVTAGILWLLAGKIDLREAANLLSKVSLAPAAFAALLGIPVMVFSGLRWRAIARVLGVRIPIGFSILNYMEGVSFNLVLPGSVGGDILRVAKITVAQGQLRKNITAVFLDRLSNLGILVVLCLMALPFSEVAEENDAFLLPFLGGVALCLVAGFGLLQLGLRAYRHRRFRIFREIFLLSASTMRILLHKRGLAEIFALSLLAQGAAVGMFYLSALALGIHGITLFEITFVTCVALLAASLPITVAGLGVREAAIIWSLAFFGVGHAQGAAMAFLVAAVIMLQTLPGFLVWVLGLAKLPKVAKA